MADTSSPSILIVYDPSKNPSKENVIYQEPSAAGSSLNNINNSNKIQHQSQMESENNVASTQPFVNLQLSETSSINNIETYQAWSIFNILFCCFCLGCGAYAYSRDTSNSKKQRDIEGALEASKKARNWNIVATMVGIIFLSPFIFPRMLTS